MSDELMFGGILAGGITAIIAGITGLVLWINWWTLGAPCKRMAQVYDMETVYTLKECYIKTPDGPVLLDSFEKRNKHE